MSDQNVAVMRRAFDLLNQRPAAFDEALALCDPEVEMRAVGRLPDTSQTPRGREAVKAWFTGLYATFEVWLEIDELIDAGDAMVVLFRQIVRGRASGAELTIGLPLSTASRTAGSLMWTATRLGGMRRRRGAEG